MSQGNAPELQKIFTAVESEYSKVTGLISDMRKYVAYIKDHHTAVKVRENKSSSYKVSYTLDGVTLRLGHDNLLEITITGKASRKAKNIMRALSFNRDAKETQICLKDSLGQTFQTRAKQVVSTIAHSVDAPKTVIVPIEHADNYMRATFAHILSHRGVSLKP